MWKLLRYVQNKHLRKWVKMRAGKKELAGVPSYQTVMYHVPHHNIRDWLLTGAKNEDAVTIGCAVARLSDEKLQRRFARMISRP
jgi:hypothetical protein